MARIAAPYLCRRIDGRWFELRADFSASAVFPDKSVLRGRPAVL